MTVACLYSRAQFGVDAPLVTIEVHILPGLPKFNIVGLPEMVVKESKERVRSALISCQFTFPSRRITVNLAPADLPKQGVRFDLPIALGILIASKQLYAKDSLLEGLEFCGELSLTGEIRPTSKLLGIGSACAKAGRALVLAPEAVPACSRIQALTCLPAKHLVAACAHISGHEALKPIQCKPPDKAQGNSKDLLDVEGHALPKRALHIAAAGGHNILLRGPPGSGKTFLAERFPGLLPPLEAASALEVAALYELKGQDRLLEDFYLPPFRTPHHTISEVALVGGGAWPLPGEVSLAHHGVLFLDECPEFSRRALEVLREPLEAGQVNLARAKQSCRYPAHFQLIAAMNPCPCGYYGDPVRACDCLPSAIARYQAKLSGPLLDRIDAHIEVSNQGARTKKEATQSTAIIQQSVQQARARQYARQGCLNARLSGVALQQHAPLSQELQSFLDVAVQKLMLSKRAEHRVIRLARTIADCDEQAEITLAHLSESLNIRAPP